jgi:thioredoxin-like negative regulator of GroEL
VYGLLYLLALVLWERWYMGRLSLDPLRRVKVRRRARHRLAVNPAEFDARVEIARDALARGRPRQALAMTESIVARADGAAEVLRLHGLALLGSGRAADAEQAFRSALANDRKESESRLGLAAALLAEERFEEARREIEAYRTGRPGDARGSWAESAIRLRAGGEGASERALASLKELVAEQRLKPGYARRRDRRWAVKARLALLTGRPPESADVLRGAT